MTQPTPPYIQNDVDLVADTIVDARLQGHRDWTDRIAHAVLDALVVAGRLQPSGGDTRTEYGVRLTWNDGTVGELPRLTRAAAEESVALHARNRVERPGWKATAELIQRTVTTGPWAEATEEQA